LLLNIAGSSIRGSFGNIPAFRDLLPFPGFGILDFCLFDALACELVFAFTRLREVLAARAAVLDLVCERPFRVGFVDLESPFFVSVTLDCLEIFGWDFLDVVLGCKVIRQA
jgi:hypothetical protein